MGAPDAPSGAGATPSREPETVTFAARDASSGPDSDLVSRVFLRCAWRHDDRSFDVTLVAPGTGDKPPTVWRAANCRQPSNVRFHNWYDRAVGALASLEAGDHFRFEFAPKTRSAGTSAGALPGGVSAFLRASDAVDAARAPPPTAVLRWTWHEPHPPAGTKGDAGDEGRFLPARLKNETNETNAQTADRRLVGTAELERVIDANANANADVVFDHTYGNGTPDASRQTQTLRTLRTNDDLLQHVASLYGESVRRNETLRLAVRRLERDLAAARSAEARSRAELTAFAETREASRSDLAMRVTLLLNEKKKKIRELELDLRAAGAQVDALEKTARETERLTGKSPSTRTGARRGPKAEPSRGADDSDADDSDTEDDALELEARAFEATRASRRSEDRDAGTLAAGTLAAGTLAAGTREGSDGDGKRKAGARLGAKPARPAAKKRRESLDDAALGTQGTLGTQGALGTQGTLGTQGALGTQGTLGTQGALGTQRRHAARKPGRRVIADDIGDDLNLF